MDLVITISVVSAITAVLSWISLRWLKTTTIRVLALTAFAAVALVSGGNRNTPFLREGFGGAPIGSVARIGRIQSRQNDSASVSGALSGNSFLNFRCDVHRHGVFNRGSAGTIGWISPFGGRNAGQPHPAAN